MKRQKNKQIPYQPPMRDANGRLTRREKISRAALALLGVGTVIFIALPQPKVDPRALDRLEQGLRNDLMRQSHLSEEDATNQVLEWRASSNSPELRYDRKRREREEEQLQQAACQMQPYLERCQ